MRLGDPVQGQVNEALETAIEAEQNPPPGIDLTDLRRGETIELQAPFMVLRLNSDE